MPFSRYWEKQKNIWMPIVWWEPTNYFDECYSFIVNSTALNRGNLSKRVYPDLSSAKRPIHQSVEVAIPTIYQLSELSQDAFNLCDVLCNTDQGTTVIMA